MGETPETSVDASSKTCFHCCTGDGVEAVDAEELSEV